MLAEELCARFSLEPHPEGGAFRERHYPAPGEARPASGSIYYYVGAGQKTAFHRIDCDEYWVHVAGAPLTLWAIDPSGLVSRIPFGTGEGEEPMHFFPRGTVFACRNDGGEGTFLACITVPRFAPEGFELISREEMERRFPETRAFFA